jgi:hypothetical protein
MLRENYKPLFSPDAIVINGLVEALSTLVRDAEMRTNLAQTALRDIETKFSIERWNRGLANAFDKALLRTSAKAETANATSSCDSTSQFDCD